LRATRTGASTACARADKRTYIDDGGLADASVGVRADLRRRAGPQVDLAAFLSSLLRRTRRAFFRHYLCARRTPDCELRKTFLENSSGARLAMGVGQARAKSELISMGIA
jgi:hypothetical protein